MRRKWFLLLPIGLGAIVLVSFLGGTIVQLLWNWLMPSLFGLPVLTFWQALGLLALTRILFGGLGRTGCRRHDRFTPEERQRFRQRVRERFGMPPAETGDSPPTVSV
jgi:hypothetical protein